MSKILTETKSVGLNFFLLFCICLSLLPLNVTAQTIDFSGKTIKEPINVEFWKRHLQDGIEIDSSDREFPHIIFHRPIDFAHATFDDSVSFVHAKFNSTADFVGTKFKGRADFWMACFDSGVSFGFAEFDSTADFMGTKFKGKADYLEADFRGDVTFSFAILPHTLDFRYVKDISREIDFTLSEPPSLKGKCYIALAGSDISKIKLNMALFTLWFPGIIHYDGDLSVYESVLKKLKDDGFMDSYQILDIEYRQFKFHHGPKLLGILNIGPLLNILNNVWWYYGYNKELVFVWAIGFWVLFSLVNLKVYPKFSESVYAIPFLEKLETSLLTGVKKRLFYFLQVVTYTAIVFFGLKMDVAKFKKGVVREHPWLFIYLMFVYVLGLVCLGFIVNIIFTR